MGEDAQQIIGGILAGGTFLLMLAIAWFAWDDSRRID